MEFFNYFLGFDNAVLSWIQLHLRSEFLDWLLVWMTKLGNGGIIWILLAVLCLCIPKYRKAGMIMAVSLILCVLLGELTLKNLVQRLRPFHAGAEIELLILAPTGYSFPSGHTASSVASSIALWQTKNKYIGIFGSILAFLIAFSRLYLFVHYPTDILGGIVLGSLVSYGVIFIDKKCSSQK